MNDVEFIVVVALCSDFEICIVLKYYVTFTFTYQSDSLPRLLSFARLLNIPPCYSFLHALT